MVAPLEQRLVAGESAALKDLFDEFGPTIMGLCRRLVGGEAEDLVQLIFLDAWRTRERYDPSRGSLGAWLTGIARFKIIDHWRANGRRPTVPQPDVGLNSSTEPEVDRIVDQLVLTKALAQLPPVRREVVQLGFYQGFSHQEIADKLAMPLGTVKSHIRRGLQTLYGELGASRGR